MLNPPSTQWGKMQRVGLYIPRLHLQLCYVRQSVCELGEVVVIGSVHMMCTDTHGGLCPFSILFPITLIHSVSLRFCSQPLSEKKPEEGISFEETV